jgi:hypothetical protein
MEPIKGRIVTKRRRFEAQDWIILIGGITIAALILWGGFAYVRAITGG